MKRQYAILNYLNQRITHTTPHLSKSSVYEIAIPNEARSLSPVNRWHIDELEKIEELFVGETLCICWQEYSPDFDTEYILIMREEDIFDNNKN